MSWTQKRSISGRKAASCLRGYGIVAVCPPILAFLYSKESPHTPLPNTERLLGFHTFRVLLFLGKFIPGIIPTVNRFFFWLLFSRRREVCRGSAQGSLCFKSNDVSSSQSQCSRIFSGDAIFHVCCYTTIDRSTHFHGSASTDSPHWSPFMFLMHRAYWKRHLVCSEEPSLPSFFVSTPSSVTVVIGSSTLIVCSSNM